MVWGSEFRVQSLGSNSPPARSLTAEISLRLQVSTPSLSAWDLGSRRSSGIGLRANMTPGLTAARSSFEY